MNNKIDITVATVEDIELMARIARIQDKKEMYRSGGRKPLEALMRSFKLSNKCYAGFYDGKLIAVFGIVTISAISRTGSPWMIASKEIEDHQIMFLRACRWVMDDLKHGYESLYNYVDNDNMMSIQWLKWLGFKLEEPQPYGKFRKPFRRFTMEGSCASQ